MTAPRTFTALPSTAAALPGLTTPSPAVRPGGSSAGVTAPGLRPLAPGLARRLRVGVDLDGVCYDFVDAMRRTVCTRTGVRPDQLPEPTEFNFYSADWGQDVTEFLDHFAYGVNAGIVFATGAPFEGSRRVLRQLTADGHSLHMVTDRGGVGIRSVAEAATRSWLASHGLPYDTLTFSADKACVPTDVFVDDKIENYRTLDAAGHHPVLFTRSYNTMHEVERRVGTWDEFYALVCDLATREGP